jgi:predicted DNA-binding transcriptional regulator AlpA
MPVKPSIEIGVNHAVTAFLLALVEQYRDQRRLLTDEDVCDLLQISRPTLWRLRGGKIDPQTGWPQYPQQIRYLMVAGRVRYTRAMVEEYLRAQERPPRRTRND